MNRRLFFGFVFGAPTSAYALGDTGPEIFVPGSPERFIQWKPVYDPRPFTREQERQIQYLIERNNARLLALIHERMQRGRF
jgi:hypothetical protein